MTLMRHARTWRRNLGMMLASIVGLTAGVSLLPSRVGATPAPAACSTPIAFIAQAAGEPYQRQAFYRPTCNASAEHLTTDPTQAAVSVALTPDGQSAIVAMVTRAWEYPLIRVNLATHALTLISNSPGQKLGLTASPSGDAVSYYRDPTPPDRSGIYIEKLDGSPPLRISPAEDGPLYGGPNDHTSWSHDGQEVAYVVSVPGHNRIVSAPVTGTQAQTTILESTPELKVGPIVTWTPDDRGLLFGGYGDDGRIFYVDRTSGLVSAVAQAGGVGLGDIKIDQHWRVFLGIQTATSGSSARIDSFWLGSPTIITTVVDNTGYDSLLSVPTGGSADPPPTGFPPSTPPPVGAPPTPTPTLPTGPPTPPQGTCPILKFYGVRGSGEKESSAGGYGSTIASMKDELAKLVPGLSATHINYPAVPVDLASPAYPVHYNDSITAGRNVLAASIRRFISACNTSYIILAGYSQGVDVLGSVYENLTEAEKRHIAAVSFFGDPHFNPKQVAIDIGDYSPQLSGILQWLGDKPRIIQAAWVSRVASYCTMGDPVCNYSRTNVAKCIPLLPAGLCAHQRYAARGFTRSAARWTEGKWRQLPRLK